MPASPEHVLVDASHAHVPPRPSQPLWVVPLLHIDGQPSQKSTRFWHCSSIVGAVVEVLVEVEVDDVVVSTHVPHQYGHSRMYVDINRFPSSDGSFNGIPSESRKSHV